MTTSVGLGCFKFDDEHGAVIVAGGRFATDLTGQTRNELQAEAIVPLQLEIGWQTRTAVTNLKPNQSTHLGQDRRHMPIV